MVSGSLITELPEGDFENWLLEHTANLSGQILVGESAVQPLQIISNNRATSEYSLNSLLAMGKLKFSFLPTLTAPGLFFLGIMLFL